MKAADVRKELKSMAEPEKAAILQRFFKTGPSQYGEGDIFIGVMVPQSRQVAKKFNQLPLGEVWTLLYSRVHEERLVALLILAWRYSSASSSREKEEIVKFYLHHFIRNGDFSDTLKIAEMLLQDRHDLIHKAVGWMLREVGKRDAAAEKEFLEKHCSVMPRTMLRYAIERLSERKRRRYMISER